MSKYDNIETAAGLVAEVTAHGLSTIQEDINRAADIMGNTSIEELAHLANDIGRNNEKGEPDPKGTWSSNRKPTQSTFYTIAFSIWNWEEATRFWNQHTNPQTEQAKKDAKELKAAKAENETLKAKLEAEERHRWDAEQKINEVSSIAFNDQRRAEAAEETVTQLKARLYDYMTAVA